MNGLNRVEIIGNVVRDAELKVVNVEGVPTPRCRFSVAVNENRSNGDTVTTYFDVTTWREYATKTAQWIRKGRQVYVCGSIALNQYVDSARKVQSHLQIRNNPTVILLGKKPEETHEESPALDEFDEEELPFT